MAPVWGEYAISQQGKTRIHNLQYDQENEVIKKTIVVDCPMEYGLYN